MNKKAVRKLIPNGILFASALDAEKIFDNAVGNAPMIKKRKVFVGGKIFDWPFLFFLPGFFLRGNFFL